MAAKTRRGMAEVMFVNSAAEWIIEDVQAGWHIQAWIELRNGLLCITELRLRSANGSSLRSAHGHEGPKGEYAYQAGRLVPLGGITSEVLRGVSLTALYGALNKDAEMTRVFGLDSDADFAVARRPGRKGHGDVFYAQWAQRYTVTCEYSRQPIADLAKKFGYERRTVHRFVAEARKRHLLLGGSPGRVGGRLSAKGQHLLDKKGKGDAQ